MESRHLGEALPRLVSRVVQSYSSDPRTQHIDREYLPSREIIIEICNVLLELTYPGYIGRKGLTQHNIGYHVGELLPRLWEHLTDQITQCLCHEQETTGPADNKTRAGCRDRAAELASQFVERIPDIRALLAEDVQAAYDGDPAASGTAEVILAYPAILAITIYRYAHELYRMDVPLLPRIMTEYAHYLTGIDIHPGARIGRFFFIDHGTGVVIGETTDIGEHVKLYQGVTLGALSFPKDETGQVIRGHKRHPTIEDDVVIYAGATILGGSTVIGRGSVIGGNTWVTHSIPPYGRVISTPQEQRIETGEAPNGSARG